MLLGVNSVKPDIWITRFVSRALGGNPTVPEAFRRRPSVGRSSRGGHRARSCRGQKSAIWYPVGSSSGSDAGSHARFGGRRSSACAETEQGLDGRHGRAAPAVAEREFIEVHLWVFVAYGAVGSAQPGLEGADCAVGAAACCWDPEEDVRAAPAQGRPAVLVSGSTVHKYLKRHWAVTRSPHGRQRYCHWAK